MKIVVLPYFTGVSRASALTRNTDAIAELMAWDSASLCVIPVLAHGVARKIHEEPHPLRYFDALPISPLAQQKEIVRLANSGQQTAADAC